MIRLYDFLIRDIFEGGHAVECSPMTQPEALATYKDCEEKLLPLFGINGVDGVDHCALGSFGKKFPEQTSGDIDIAVSCDKIASIGGVSLEGVDEYICKVLDENNIIYNYSKGLRVISVQWKVPDSDKYGQVDIMPTTSLDFSKWMYYSPDFRVAESKYKGLYRNQLIIAILKYIKRDIIKMRGDEIEEYERYSLRLYSGLATTRRSLLGKNGKLVKTETALKDFERHVSSVPDEIVRITFGNDNLTSSQVLTFEDAYKILMSDSFKYKDKREEIIKAFIKALKSSKFPIPSEVEKDWGYLLQ